MDYKFILILAICLILYYIYHELEKVKIQVEELTEKIEKKTIINNQQKHTSVNSKPKSNLPEKKIDYGVTNPSMNLGVNPSMNLGVNPSMNLGTNPSINLSVNKSIPKPILKTSVPALNIPTTTKTVQVRSPNQASVSIPLNTKVHKLDNTDDIILIDDDITTVDSMKKEEVNVMSETETPESYENNSQDLALYSNDNNETSITVDDIIEKTEENLEENKINTIIEEDEDDDLAEQLEEDEEDDLAEQLEEDEINIIENDNDSSEILLLDDSNEASTSSTELKKKNQKSLNKLNEIPIITDSLNKILSTKQEIICTDTSDKDSDDEEIDVNIDIDEIVNESSNNKLKMKTLKRKKLAELQKIAAEYNISLNKVKDGKLKNKTKNELCKEIVSKQY